MPKKSRSRSKNRKSRAKNRKSRSKNRKSRSRYPSNNPLGNKFSLGSIDEKISDKYSPFDSIRKRRAVIREQARHESPRETWKGYANICTLAKQNKKVNPKLATALQNDCKWMKRTFRF